MDGSADDGRAPAAMRPWRRSRALGFVGALAVVACSALVPARAVARSACADENAPISGSSPAALRASVTCLVNATRLEHGLPALRQDARLDLAAQQHTDDMVAGGYFGHTGPDGRSFSQRITASGYAWAQAGENIAQGFSTPASVVEAWMVSRTHCVSILEPGFRDIGVGINLGAARPGVLPGTWTQDFGRLQGEPATSADTGPRQSCPLHLPAVTSGGTPPAAGGTPPAAGSSQPSSGSPPATDPPPASLAGVGDSTAPVTTLSASRSQTLGKTARVRVSCPDEACLARASGTVRVPKVGRTRAKRYKLRTVKADIAKAEGAELRPALSNAARRAIRRALRRGRPVIIRLRITVADVTGNTRTLTRQVKLRL